MFGPPHIKIITFTSHAVFVSITFPSKGHFNIDALDDRYLNGKGSESSKQYPASWSYLPADQELEKAYEEACQLRQAAPSELFTRYNSKAGSLRHLVKYRPDICAAMDLVGCLVGALAAEHTQAVPVTVPVPARDEMTTADACGLR